MLASSSFVTPAMDGLQIVGIEKSFGENRAVSGVSFDVKPGETVAVLGPSGCGKSTLLSIISGLEKADRGDLFWNGISIEDIPTHKRGFGLMFQDFALFPHMDVYENVAFGLRMSSLVGVRDPVACGAGFGTGEAAQIRAKRCQYIIWRRAAANSASSIARAAAQAAHAR